MFSTTTAALLAPTLERPYAIRLDAPAAVNRPGARNALQRGLERRRLAPARLLLPWSYAAAAALPGGSAPSIVLPPPVAPSGPSGAARERLAVAYAPGPREKGLELLCSAWARAKVDDARLDIFGLSAERGRAYLARRGAAEPAGVRWMGVRPATEFRAALRRARAFVSSAAWEDFGLVQLEALADGALLVCAPAGGTFEALPIARALEPGLVATDRSVDALAGCVHHAFGIEDDDVAAYRAAAAAHLADYAPEAVSKTFAEQVIPALLE